MFDSANCYLFCSPPVCVGVSQGKESLDAAGFTVKLPLIQSDILNRRVSAQVWFYL